MSDDLFSTPDGYELPPHFRRALAKHDAAEVVAAFERCGLLTIILRIAEAGADAPGAAADLALETAAHDRAAKLAAAAR